MSLNNSRVKQINKNLRLFLQKHERYKSRVEYTYEELREFLEDAKNYYRREPTALCELGIPVYIVGDIHGQYADLHRIFAMLGCPGKTRYLFLGDYVDRGPQSLECICVLFAFKLIFPDRIFLLRGNHECDYVNRAYGFWDELRARFKLGAALSLFKLFNELFTYLPLAALVRNRVLCMHGGLSSQLQSLDDIRRLPMPVLNLTSSGLAQDLLWADPKKEASGFEFNEQRECSVAFGEDVVRNVCKKLHIDLVVRAHQVMTNGYAFFADRHLVTVFSAPRYVPEMNNKGAVMHISNKMVVRFVILNPVKPDGAGVNAFVRSFNDDSVSAFSCSMLELKKDDTAQSPTV